MEPVWHKLLSPEDEVHDGWVLATLGTATDGGVLEAAAAKDFGRIQTVGLPYTGYGDAHDPFILIKACRMHHLL